MSAENGSSSVPNRRQRREHFGGRGSQVSKNALLLTRMGGKVFLGIEHHGYVELELAEARAIAEELFRLSEPRVPG